MPPPTNVTLLRMHPWIKRNVTNSGDFDGTVVYSFDGVAAGASAGRIIETWDGCGNLYQQSIQGTRDDGELVMLRVKDKGDLCAHRGERSLRMTRISLFATLASLILWIATSALWSRSYFRYDIITVPVTRSSEVCVSSGAGVIRVTSSRFQRGTTEGFSRGSMDLKRIPPHIDLFKKGFYFTRGRVSARDGW